MLIYHYTPLKTFHSIVKNVMESKENEKSFEFWASSSFCMNDVAEFIHGYNVLKELLPSFENGIDERLRLSELERQTSIVGKSSNYVSKLIKDNSVIMDKMPYVISFSFMPDYLPMWYMYADRGEGVCMGFELEELMGAGWYVWPVIYDYQRIDNDFRNWIRGEISNIYTDYLKRVDNIKHDIYLLWDEKITTIRLMCTLLAPIFKHQAFEFENEYRLVQYGCEGKVEKRQTEKGTVVSYVKVRIPFQILKKVIIGPCADSKVFHAIHTEFKYCNPLHLVEIEPSLLPYRNI